MLLGPDLKKLNKDDDNRLIIKLGAKYKSFEQFISEGDVIVIKENKIKKRYIILFHRYLL